MPLKAAVQMITAVVKLTAAVVKMTTAVYARAQSFCLLIFKKRCLGYTSMTLFFILNKKCNDNISIQNKARFR